MGYLPLWYYRSYRVNTNYVFNLSSVPVVACGRWIYFQSWKNVPKCWRKLDSKNWKRVSPGRFSPKIWSCFRLQILEVSIIELITLLCFCSISWRGTNLASLLSPLGEDSTREMEYLWSPPIRTVRVLRYMSYSIRIMLSMSLAGSRITYIMPLLGL